VSSFIIMIENYVKGESVARRMVTRRWYFDEDPVESDRKKWA